jgi:hypothetical protein
MRGACSEGETAGRGNFCAKDFWKIAVARLAHPVRCGCPRIFCDDMSEYRRQSAFIRNLLAYDESPASLALQARLVAAERNEHCIFSACRLVLAIGVLSLGGFGYTAVLLPEFFENSSHLLVKLFSALGLGSGLCLVVFVVLWLWYRGTANKVRQECRDSIGLTLDRVLRPEIARSAPVIQHAPFLLVARPTPACRSQPAAPSSAPSDDSASSGDASLRKAS